ncbi:hypothetical protein OE88DRAFT_1740539 [Heliocybe sulcata]|uniref:Uncharacterized protein n=1 Tax=Heliocybe sulcata TaxID=5364 RepID=A0A5C3MLK9_9AGAM|nr:hypothetical protein OE88DRAFT_1740539 [Heliocybe sulcata]
MYLGACLIPLLVQAFGSVSLLPLSPASPTAEGLLVATASVTSLLSLDSAKEGEMDGRLEERDSSVYSDNSDSTDDRRSHLEISLAPSQSLAAGTASLGQNISQSLSDGSVSLSLSSASTTTGLKRLAPEDPGASLETPLLSRSPLVSACSVLSGIVALVQDESSFQAASAVPPVSSGSPDPVLLPRQATVYGETQLSPEASSFVMAGVSTLLIDDPSPPEESHPAPVMAAPAETESLTTGSWYASASEASVWVEENTVSALKQSLRKLEEDDEQREAVGLVKAPHVLIFEDREGVNVLPGLLKAVEGVVAVEVVELSEAEAPKPGSRTEDVKVPENVAPTRAPEDDWRVPSACATWLRSRHTSCVAALVTGASGLWSCGGGSSVAFLYAGWHTSEGHRFHHENQDASISVADTWWQPA